MGKRTGGTIIFMAGLMSVTLASGFFQSAGSGMVVHLRVEEAAGPTAFDLSGVAPPNHGTWTGGVTALAGPVNTAAALGANSTQCVSLNGTTGYLSVPGAGIPSLAGDFTAALWVYKVADHASDYVRIIGKGASGIRTFGLWDDAGANERLLFQQYNNAGGSVLHYYSTGTVPDGQWTHIACRMSGNQGTIFIDGVNNNPATGTVRSGPSGTDTEPLTIGSGAGAGLHSYWNGRLDDIRVYNRALTDAEIVAIAAGTQGPVAPTGLAAVAGDAQVSLTWTASVGMVYNVKRSTVSGGPYTAVGQNISGGVFVDNSAQNFTQYFYVVSGVTYGEGDNSTEVTATPVPPVITARPNAGLFTSEDVTSVPFDLTVNRVVPAGTVIDVTLTSTRPLEGRVSAGGLPSTQIVVQVVGPQAIGFFQVITVTGVDDSFVDGPQSYQVTVTTASADPLFNNLTIPPVSLTNNDNDQPGITFTPISGLTTNESGGSAVFSVTLNRQPFDDIDLPLTSLVPAEVAVSPTTLRFTSAGFPAYVVAGGIGTANWNVAHIVTLTGVDDAMLDFTIPFTVQSGNLAPVDMVNDGVYASLATPDVTGVNIDNEVIPTLEPVWSGGSGGCGLLGPELLLPFALLRLRRRRRGENQPG